MSYDQEFQPTDGYIEGASATVKRLLAVRASMLGAYKASVKYLKSQEYDDDVAEVFTAVGAYLPGEPPEKAVYLIARAETVARKIRSVKELIDQMKTVEEKLSKYRVSLPADSPLLGEE